MHIYEYLFAAILIVSILLGSSIMIGTLSDPHRDISEKEQLKETAQKIMTQILLDPGEPVNWGSNISVRENDLKAFGLAMYGETTREAYVLDPNKVLRLNKTEPSLAVTPISVLNLLNLGYDYGIALEFLDPLIVGISETSNSDKYEVSVSSEYGGLPVAGANVTARIFHAPDLSNDIIGTNTTHNFTRTNGNCTIDFGNIESERKIAIIAVDYYGVRTVKTYVREQSLQNSKVKFVNILGNYLFSATMPKEIASEIVVTKNVVSGEYLIRNTTFSVDTATSPYELNYLDPYTLAVLIVSHDDQSLLVATKDITSTYSSISGSWSFPFAYAIERTVVAGGSTYIARLHLWRMSW